MERFISQKLSEWKNNPNRKPLILRGARQVGKTWIIEDFGKRQFQGRIHIIDLEKRPDLHSLFDINLDVRRIIAELEILLNIKIKPGNDLLFFDEVQSCPRVLMALRYFYEDMPELHVITAGSLLEFVMKDITFPVGRVQFLNMHPMTFAEFLMATGKGMAAETIQSPPGLLSESIHQMLLFELRNYFFIGGMPECVKAFIHNRKFQSAFEIQAQLVDTFRQDFSKYAPYSDKRCLNAVFTNTARSIGQQIKYTRLADGFSMPTIKKAFDLLIRAKIINKVSSASPAGLPLGFTASEKKFKATLIDIGLMQHLCGMHLGDEFQKSDLLAIYQGALAEQFVGQELLAAGQGDLYYWSRDAKSSTAEVDYLVIKDGKIIPVEVKSSASGRLRSLHMILKSYKNISEGNVFSSAEFSRLPEQKLTFIPIYYVYSMFKQKPF